jgi:hypothetical protein
VGNEAAYGRLCVCLKVEEVCVFINVSHPMWAAGKSSRQVASHALEVAMEKRKSVWKQTLAERVNEAVVVGTCGLLQAVLEAVHPDDSFILLCAADFPPCKRIQSVP